MAKEIVVRIVSIVTITVIIIGLVFGGYLFISNKANKKSSPVITLMSALTEVSDISQLSTYTTIYQGVVRIYNEEQSDKLDYYVTYDATIRAGIDLKAITEESFTVDEDTQVIELNLPEVTIEEPVVDPVTLDYIFINKKANKQGVSQDALKACKADVVVKAEERPEIKEQAKENAKRTMEALTKALIEQMNKSNGTSYRLEVKG